MSADSTQPSDTQTNDEHTPSAADAGRMPTAEEEAVADENAKDVDLDAVETEYRDMTEKGANVKGEGEIP